MLETYSEGLTQDSDLRVKVSGTSQEQFENKRKDGWVYGGTEQGAVISFSDSVKLYAHCQEPRRHDAHASLTETTF